MKKTLLIAALAGVAAVPSVSADTLLGVYAGAQYWDTGTSGGFASTNSTADFDFDDEGETAFYIAFEHFVPFVPNIKVAHTTLESNGSTLLTSNFEFDGTLYTVGSTVDTISDITSTDFILYYELFDNDLLSFDLGINGKYIDGTLNVADTASNLMSQEEFSGVIPMLYSRVEVGLPFTGLSAYAEGSYLTFDDHELSDFQVAITYDLIESVALDLTLQVGYRDVTVDVEDLDDIYADLSYDGVFAGIEMHF